MKIRIFLVAVTMFFGANVTGQTKFQPSKKEKTMNPILYSQNITVKDINGRDFDLKSLEGKKVMIVNTASECGFTPQYADLEKLYQQYSNTLVILGFPTNDFGQQEPGSDKEIATFCQKNYGVTFPMMSKIQVVGEQMHPLYKFLTTRANNGLEDSKVAWNFQKYLLDEKGHLVKVLPSKVSPLDPDIISWLGSKK